MHWLWNSQSFHTHTHLNIYAYICKYISRANANLKAKFRPPFLSLSRNPRFHPCHFPAFTLTPPPACATPVHFLSIFWHLNVLRCRFSRFLFVHFICWLPLPVFPCPPPYTPGFSALSPPTILPPSPNPPLTLQSSLQPPTKRLSVVCASSAGFNCVCITTHWRNNSKGNGNAKWRWQWEI